VIVVALAAAVGAVARPSGPTDEIAYLGNGKVYLVQADGTNRRVFVSGGPARRVDNWGDLSWTRDGERIAFTVGNHNLGSETLQIAVASADGKQIRPLTAKGYGAFDPTWSPDGTRLAFAEDSPKESGIAVIDADGSGLRLIAKATGGDNYWVPDWSPDGDWILFDSWRGEGLRSKLMAVHPDGTGLHQLAVFNTGGQCICADWSPDGTRIAYEATTKPSSSIPEIYVMNADGSGRTRLTQNNARDENPDWSPDGDRIAFYSERRGDAEIYVIGTDGGTARRVTRDPWYSDGPAWRPS
jgi:TolB protein